jgi:hypothetical protein
MSANAADSGGSASLLKVVIGKDGFLLPNERCCASRQYDRGYPGCNQKQQHTAAHCERVHERRLINRLRTQRSAIMSPALVPTRTGRAAWRITSPINALLPEPMRCGEAESIQDDLIEEFSLLASKSGVASARRWYWRQTMKTVPPLAGVGFRTAPWMTTAAVVGGFLLRERDSARSAE